MIFLVLAACAAMAVRIWSRMTQMELAIGDLTARLAALEKRREPSPSPAVAVPLLTPRVAPPKATPIPALPVPVPAPVREATSVITAPASPALADAGQSHSLETRIGSRWLLYIGVVAIVIGASYFEKLAIDNNWLGETARTVQGAIAGLVLVAAGLRFVRAGYRVYGQVLSGCGVAILYVSTYAAFNFYHLIGQPAAYTLMSAVTMLAAWLADRQRSQPLALVAVGGGFATPFLLPSSADAEIALFAYETILIAGTLFLASRRDWLTLNIVSYGFTILTVSAWAVNFYDASKHLPTELFLTLYCAMYLYILRECRHSRHPSLAAARVILWTAPILYYFASLAILAQHSAALLTYLVLVAVAGVIVGSRARSWARLGFWIAVADPLLLWSNAHAGRAWLAAGLAAWSGVYVLNLIGLLEATVRKEGRFSGADIALLHLNGLAAYAGAYLLIEPVRLATAGPLAAGFAAWHGIIGAILLKRRRDEALHFVALAFTLLIIAVVLQFEGAWITTAWAAEGAVIVWLALRERRDWLRAGGVLLFAVAISRLIALQFSDPPVGQLLIVNRRAACGAFVIALTYLVTLAHRRYGDSGTSRRETGIGLVIAKLLLLAQASSEIISYWKIHAAPPFEPASQLVAACLIVGAVIMWLGLLRQQEWIRGVGGVVVADGAFLLLSAQFLPAPHIYMTMLNGRAAAGVFAVVTLYGLVVLHRRLGSHLADLPVNLAVLNTAASLLTLSLLTSEIDAFWAARGAANIWSSAREGLQAIAWAAVGSFLVWRGLLARRTWIRTIGAVVLAAGVLRLLRAQFASVTPTYVVVANARVTAALVVTALLYGLAWLYGRAGEPLKARDGRRTLILFVANALTLTLLTSEITAYWHVHDARHAAASLSADSHFAREMMLSVTWALYATALVVVGLVKQYAPIRYFAIAVFVVTIAKVFAIDLAELDRIYRVLSVVGLGIALLMTSYLYHRFRLVEDNAS